MFSLTPTVASATQIFKYQVCSRLDYNLNNHNCTPSWTIFLKPPPEQFYHWICSVKSFWMLLFHSVPAYLSLPWRPEVASKLAGRQRWQGQEYQGQAYQGMECQGKGTNTKGSADVQIPKEWSLLQLRFFMYTQGECDYRNKNSIKIYGLPLVINSQGLL